MEIIQQKLIWLLGCASLMAVLLKLDTNRYIAGKLAAVKLKTGISLMIGGTVVGILARAGWLGDWIPRSGLAFYAENIIGYVLGWSLIIWGILDWSRESYDDSGRPLLHGRYRIFSEKVSEALGKNDSSGAFLEEIAPYLLAILDCQALAFHREDGGRLRLNFHDGLTPRGAQQIFEPLHRSIYHSALADGKPSVLTQPQTPEDLPETSIGMAREVLCCPLTDKQGISAVVTLFSVKPISLGSDDLNYISIVANALLPIMKREKLDAELLMLAGLDEERSAISRAFRDNNSLVSALLRSSKVIYDYLPFNEINFYTMAGGRARTLDFPLPNGGKVNIVNGYLKKSEYPFLYPDQNQVADNSTHSHRTRKNHIRRLKTPGQSSWIEIIPRSPEASLPHLEALLDAMADGLAAKLADDNIERINQQTHQWLGALRHCLENGLAADDLASFLRETAQAAVDIEAAAFCRITLCDPDKTNLKTAALAQVRTLHWPMSQVTSVPLEKAELHRQALLEKTRVSFDLSKTDKKMSDQEMSFLLPDDVKYGSIVPLVIAGRAVGLVTFGEIRDRHRDKLDGLDDIFMTDLAAVVSLVLTHQRDKKLAEGPKEGPKKLKLQAPRPVQVAPREFTPGLRSRLNGPLAGILASCEYLKDSRPNAAGDVGRFLEVIERNALKIQDIATGLAVDNKQRG